MRNGVSIQQLVLFCPAASQDAYRPYCPTGII